MSFHLGASQQAFLLTLDRNSAGGDSHHWHESTLCLLVWWVPFKALVPLSLGSLGEGRDFQMTARKVAFGEGASGLRVACPLYLNGNSLGSHLGVNCSLCWMAEFRVTYPSSQA